MPFGAGDFNLRIQAEQRRRRVARKYRPALRSARSHVAQVAIFLNAESAALAPRERLVVPKAARVEADVAADRSHVAQHGRSHGGSGLGKDGIMLPQKSRTLDRPQRSQARRSLHRRPLAEVLHVRIPRNAAIPRRSRTYSGSKSFCRIDGIRSVPPASTRILLPMFWPSIEPLLRRLRGRSSLN